MDTVRIKKRNIPENLLPYFKKQKEGDRWRLRNVIVWHKPNCMPSSVKDRFTVDYEPVFMFSKSKKYWFETQYEPYQIDENRPHGVVRNREYGYQGKYKTEHKAGHRDWQEGMNNRGKDAVIKLHPKLGRNKRSVWKIPTRPYAEAHFAVFPEALIETPIKAGCPEFICKKCGMSREKIIDIDYIKNRPSAGNDKRSRNEDRLSDARGHGGWRGNNLLKQTKELGYTDCGCNAGWESGIVLDPFMGSGTTALVARQLGRNYLGIELNENYIKLAEKRLSQNVLF